VVALAHAAGARVVVDAAQLAPHRPFSLAETGADYVAISGHKLYAPYGAGALIGRRDWLDAGRPYLAGGGAVTNVAVAHTSWEPAPQRHEAGSPNVIGALALGVAATELTAVAGRLAEHDGALRERLVSGLTAIPGVQVLRLWPDSADPVSVVSFTVAGHDAGLVAAYLSAEHGVGVRDGRFCAHPLLEARGVEAGLRASIGLGTSTEDIDRLVRGVSEFVTTGPRSDYEVAGGRWRPRDDQRELPEAIALLRALHADSDASSVLATAAAGAGCGPAPSVAEVLAAVSH
jgi:selenocysteine lyase/cysteine desulfurase